MLTLYQHMRRGPRGDICIDVSILEKLLCLCSLLECYSKCLYTVLYDITVILRNDMYTKEYRVVY